MRSLNTIRFSRRSPRRRQLTNLFAVAGILLLMTDTTLAQSGSRSAPSRGSGSRQSAGNGARTSRNRAAAPRTGSRTRFSQPSRNSGGSDYRGSGNTATGSGSRNQPRVETITGTLVEINRRGRKTTLVVRDNQGQQADIAITPEIEASLQAPAGEELLTVDRFVSANARRVGKQLVASDYTVHIGFHKRQLPSRLDRLPQGNGAYFVSGIVLSREPVPSQSDTESLTLRVGPRDGTDLVIAPGSNVTLRSADLSLAKAGANVEIQGLRRSNGSFQIRSVQIRQQTPFSPSELEQVSQS